MFSGIKKNYVLNIHSFFITNLALDAFIKRRAHFTHKK